MYATQPPTAPGFPPGSAGRAHTGAKFRSGDLTERILFDQPYPPPDGGFEVLVTAEDAMALVISIESGLYIRQDVSLDLVTEHEELAVCATERPLTDLFIPVDKPGLG
ncbi:hypothetical protein RRG08_008824 [Elysia crispata]|uniref:Uncharacterized protein n=1 Tax=Elysia crispata TaxID=231223 RepID=A0AAE1CKT0_9GAST|nr:hypothetical protein RRG08_008824 [Elysia crispata]